MSLICGKSNFHRCYYVKFNILLRAKSFSISCDCKLRLRSQFDWTLSKARIFPMVEQRSYPVGVLHFKAKPEKVVTYFVEASKSLDFIGQLLDLRREAN